MQDDAAVAASDDASLTVGLTGSDAIAIFQSLATSSPDGIVVADPAGVVIWANDVAHAMFGVAPGGMTGRPVTDLLPETLVEEARALRGRVLAGEQVGTLETVGRRSDGAFFPLSLTPAVRRTPESPESPGGLGDRVLGLSAIVRDLTDEHRVRRELTEALARSKARFDQIGMPQALLDLERRVVAVNDAACRLLDRDCADLVGAGIGAVLQPLDADVARADLEALVAGELDVAETEATATRADGTRVPLSVQGSVVRADDGSPREIALFLTDLTTVREAQRRLQDQDSFFGRLYRRAADPAMVVEREATISYVSPSFTDVLGYRPEEIVGRSAFDLLHPDQEDEAREVLARLLPRPGSTERMLVRLAALGGEWHWFDATATSCLDDPLIDGMIVNLREVTAEIDTRDELRRSEARYRAIVETAQEGILAIDPAGCVAFANEKSADILGLDLETIYAEGLLDRLTPEQQSELLARLASRLETGPEQFELLYPHPARGPVLIEVAASPLVDDDGKSMGSLAMIADVTSERQAADELRHQALHDSLTGLPNRSLLVDRLAMAAARQHRDHSAAIAALYLDLDHFKAVNDRHGHDAGDRLLVEVAARLETAVRETDTVARLGGDEFAIVCEESSPDEADAVAQRVQEALQAPVDLGGEAVYVGASIGVALSPPHHTGDLLRYADAAMYESKSSGRGRVSSFRSDQSDLLHRRAALQDAVREALAVDGVVLDYQPIVAFEGHRLIGLEALLRFHAPGVGPVPPEEVMVAADTGGLSFELDRAVSRRAAQDLIALRDQGLVGPDVHVAVNVSARTTQQQRIDDLVRETLAVSGLPPQCLSLEITEHAIMDNAEHAVVTLRRLAETGVLVAIDDFGTGYNSLVQLQRLPATTLKIDRSFVARLHEDHAARVISQSIVGLALALGLRTVAEGVETPAQLAFLREIGCVAGQGGFWAPATAVSDLPRALDRLPR